MPLLKELAPGPDGGQLPDDFREEATSRAGTVWCDLRRLAYEGDIRWIVGACIVVKRRSGFVPMAARRIILTHAQARLMTIVMASSTVLKRLAYMACDAERTTLASSGKPSIVLSRCPSLRLRGGGSGFAADSKSSWMDDYRESVAPTRARALPVAVPAIHSRFIFARRRVRLTRIFRHQRLPLKGQIELAAYPTNGGGHTEADPAAALKSSKISRSASRDSTAVLATRQALNASNRRRRLSGELADPSAQRSGETQA